MQLRTRLVLFAGLTYLCAQLAVFVRLTYWRVLTLGASHCLPHSLTLS